MVIKGFKRVRLRRESLAHFLSLAYDERVLTALRDTSYGRIAYSS